MPQLSRRLNGRVIDGGQPSAALPPAASPRHPAARLFGGRSIAPE